jgi:hypothetical protein
MEILDELHRLWDSTRDSHSATDASTKAERVYSRLRELFSEEQIINEITRFLNRIISLMSVDKAPDRPDIGRCTICLALISDPRGVRISSRLARDIARVFPISIWYRAVMPVVKAYLSRADLLEALIIGLRGESHPATIENCLQAVRMYAHSARKDDDPERVRDLVTRIAPLIERYKQDVRADIARYAARADVALRAYLS